MADWHTAGAAVYRTVAACCMRDAACYVMIVHDTHALVRADGRGGMCTRTPVSEGMDDVPMGCEMRG